jgi:4-amino-4-deoxy-L-arabinose transferase-like glycosyltransferase
MPWRALLVIAVVGVALRLIVSWAIWSNGGSSLNGDEGSYVLSAIAVYHGQDIPDVLLWVRAPGYIFFEAGALFVTGGQLLGINLAQIALVPFLVVLTYFLGTFATEDRRTAERTGVWAAGLIACNPILIFYDNLFVSEPLYIFLLAFLVLALVQYARVASKPASPDGSLNDTLPRTELTVRLRPYGWLVMAGLLAGLCLLTRSSILAYLPLVVGWLIYLHRRALGKAVLAVLVFAAFAAVVVLPWSFHNVARYGDFILVDTTGPVNFFLDNNDLSRDEAQVELDKISGQGARQEYAMRSTVNWVLAHKGQFLGNVTSRIASSLLPDAFTEMRLPVREKMPGTPSWYRDFYALAGSIAYTAIVVLAVAGLIYAPRSNLKVLVVLLVISTVAAASLTHNNPRYQLPSIALLTLFSGYALARRRVFWPVKEGGKVRVRTALSLGFAILFVLVALPAILPGLISSVQARGIEVSSHFKGSPQERAVDLEQAARLDRVLSTPWRQAADEWLAAGEESKALDDYFEAWLREPNDWRAAAMLSKLYRERGEIGRSEKTADGVQSAFAAIMQSWAWEQIGPPDGELDVGGPDIGWVKGFHGRENTSVEGGTITYRWSTGSAALKVRKRAGDTGVVLKARALPGANGEPLPVRFRINGVDAGVQMMDGQWRSYRFTLPGGMVPDATVVLQIDAQARQPSVDDLRDLAVAVDGVSTEP